MACQCSRSEARDIARCRCLAFCLLSSLSQELSLFLPHSLPRSDCSAGGEGVAIEAAQARGQVHRLPAESGRLRHPQASMRAARSNLRSPDTWIALFQAAAMPTDAIVRGREKAREAEEGREEGAGGSGWKGTPPLSAHQALQDTGEELPRHIHSRKLPT